MVNILTSGCENFGHPEFRIEFDPKAMLESDASYFADMLVAMVRDGSCFKNDQSFQVGWSFTKIVLEDDGFLTFLEPDFKSMPIVWQRGLTNSLRHLRLHKDVAESLLPTEMLAVPSLRESCIICTKLSGSSDLLMDRQNQQGKISGWFLGCLDEEHDHNNTQSLRVISLYEAVVNHAPRALEYLGLPPGILLLLGSGTPSIMYNGDALKIRKHSYLEAFFGKGNKHKG
ncbi:MAG TPA: hypothetical protein VF472_04095 [Burkholderiaceae bacterium]